MAAIVGFIFILTTVRCVISKLFTINIPSGLFVISGVIDDLIDRDRLNKLR